MESGILYTVVMFIAGVTLSMQVGALKPLSIPLDQLSTYTEAILVPMAVSLLLKYLSNLARFN